MAAFPDGRPARGHVLLTSSSDDEKVDGPHGAKVERKSRAGWRPVPGVADWPCPGEAKQHVLTSEERRASMNSSRSRLRRAADG